MNSSIWHINGTLTDTTTLSQSEPDSNGNKGVCYIPQTPRLEPHYQMQLNVIPKTLYRIETHWLSSIEKVPGTTVNNEFHDDRLLGYAVNNVFYCQILRQNSTDLLNDTSLYIYIYIYIYIYNDGH